MVRMELRLPSPAEYMSLRASVGWKVPSAVACDRALRGTRFAVCATEDDEAVGMGRLIGDNTLYWFIVDLVVNPLRQGEGIASRIVRTLEEVAAEESATGIVNLVAAPDVIPFYHNIGYELVDSSLMAKRLRK